MTAVWTVEWSGMVVTRSRVPWLRDARNVTRRGALRDHSRDGSGCVPLATDGGVACNLQLRSHVTERPLATIDRIARQLLCEPHHLGITLLVALPTTALACCSPLAIARALELGHQRCFLELADGAEDLPHHRCRRAIVKEGVGAIRGDQINAHVLQKLVADLLNHQLTGKTASVLDDDRSHAVAGDMGKDGREAGTLVDRVRALHAVVAVFRDDLVAGALGVLGHGLALALQRVLVLPHIGI